MTDAKCTCRRDGPSDPDEHYLACPVVALWRARLTLTDNVVGVAVEATDDAELPPQFNERQRSAAHAALDLFLKQCEDEAPAMLASGRAGTVGYIRIRGHAGDEMTLTIEMTLEKELT